MKIFLDRRGKSGKTYKIVKNLEVGVESVKIGKNWDNLVNSTHHLHWIGLRHYFELRKSKSVMMKRKSDCDF